MKYKILLLSTLLSLSPLLYANTTNHHDIRQKEKQTNREQSTEIDSQLQELKDIFNNVHAQLSKPIQYCINNNDTVKQTLEQYKQAAEFIYKTSEDIINQYCKDNPEGIKHIIHFLKFFNNTIEQYLNNNPQKRNKIEFCLKMIIDKLEEYFIENKDSLEKIQSLAQQIITSNPKDLYENLEKARQNNSFLTSLLKIILPSQKPEESYEIIFMFIGTYFCMYERIIEYVKDHPIYCESLVRLAQFGKFVGDTCYKYGDYNPKAIKALEAMIESESDGTRTECTCENTEFPCAQEYCCHYDIEEDAHSQTSFEVSNNK